MKCRSAIDRLLRLEAALTAGRVPDRQDADALARALRRFIEGADFGPAIGLLGNWRKAFRSAARDEILRAAASEIEGADKAARVLRQKAIRDELAALGPIPSARTVRRAVAKNSPVFGHAHRAGSERTGKECVDEPEKPLAKRAG